MNNPFVWILIVVIVVIAVPVVGHLIRKKDFKDQITGKKPERGFFQKTLQRIPKKVRKLFRKRND